MKRRFTLACCIMVFMACTRHVEMPKNPSELTRCQPSLELQFLQGVVDGKKFARWQLDRSVGCLEVTTGIDSGLPTTNFGYAFDKRTLKEAVKKWEAELTD